MSVVGCEQGTSAGLWTEHRISGVFRVYLKAVRTQELHNRDQENNEQ